MIINTEEYLADKTRFRIGPLVKVPNPVPVEEEADFQEFVRDRLWTNEELIRAYPLFLESRKDTALKQVAR